MLSLVVGSLLCLPGLLRREQVSLSVVSCAHIPGGGRSAYLCLSNASSQTVTFVSSGGTRPYFHLIEYLTLSTNPPVTLVTNYNQDAFYHVGEGRLAPNSAVFFPVEIPSDASNATITVNYLPPSGYVRDLVADLRTVFSGRPNRPTRSYKNLTLRPPD
jgi:hypothetical protein